MGDRAPIVGQVRDTIRKATKVVEGPRRRTEEAVRKMAERPNFDLLDAPQLAWELVQKGFEQAGKAKGVLDAQVRRRLNEIGLATQDEIDALRARVAELEAMVAAPPSAPARAPAPDDAEPRPPRPPRAAGAKADAAARAKAAPVSTTPRKPVRRAPGEPRAEPEAEQIKLRGAPGEPRAEPEAEQIKQRRAPGEPRAEPEAEQTKSRAARPASKPPATGPDARA